MFRRSSPRAFSSTRHTACLPCSAQSISALTRALSSLVRYTVVFSAITSGSRAAAAANASNVVRNDSYGTWVSRSARAISSKNRAELLRAREPRRRHRRPRLVLQVGPVEPAELAAARTGRAALRSRTPGRARRRARSCSRSSIALDAELDTSTRTTSPNAPAPELRLDGLEQVVGVVGELEVHVARDPEHRTLGDLHPGEQRREEVRDHRLERDPQRFLADRDEAGEPLGDLDAGEPLLTRCPGRPPARPARARDPRCTGTADPARRPAGSAPDRSPARRTRSAARSSASRAVLDPDDDDALGGERRPQLALPEPRLPRRQLDRAFADLRQRLLRGEPVGRAKTETAPPAVPSARPRGP